MGGRKGVGGGAPGVFIGGLFHGEGARVQAGEEIDGAESCRAGKGERGWRREMTHGPGRSEVEEVLTRGVLLSAGERGRGDTLSGLALGGPWAASAAGPNRFPSAFFYFLFLLSFLFLISFSSFANLI
jgi:hypothetical protein